MRLSSTDSSTSHIATISTFLRGEYPLIWSPPRPRRPTHATRTVSLALASALERIAAVPARAAELVMNCRRSILLHLDEGLFRLIYRNSEWKGVRVGDVVTPKPRPLNGPRR